MYRRLPQTLFSLLRPSGEQLSPEAQRQVQFHRLLTLLGAVMVPLFGLLYDQANPAAVDPTWARLLVAGLFAALFVASYGSGLVRRHYVRGTWAVLYVTMGWFAALTMLNHYAPDYAVGFLLVFSVLTAAVGLGAGSIRPVLWFAGFGFFLAAGGTALSPAPGTNPLIVLASVGTVAIAALSVIQGRLSTWNELRRRQEQLATAQQIAGLGRWERDFETDELYWSAETRRIFGWDPEERVTYEQFMETVHPGDRKALRRQQERLLKDGVPIDLEYRIVRPDGEERIVRERGTAEFDEDGDPVHVLGTVLDVTEEREREEKLRRTTARLTALYEDSPDMINIHDPEGTIIDPNPRLLEKTGYDRDELEGMKVWKLDQKIAPDEVKALWESMETGDRTELEGAYRRKDGSVFPVEVHVRKLDLEGENRFMAISRDVTERKRREERLRGRRQKIEALYEATSRLLEARSPAAVSDRIHEVLQEVFDYPLNNTGFLEGELIVPKETRVEEALQVPSPSPQPRDADTVSGRAVRAGDTVVVEEVEALDNGLDYGDLSSAAGVPIGDHGVIVVGQAEGRHFERFNLRLIEVLASYAALVLDRLDRVEELLSAKEEAEEAETLFETIFENVPVMIEILDFETGYRRVNDHLEEVLGWTSEELREHPTTTELLYSTQEEVRRARKLVKEAPEGWHELQPRAKSGEPVDAIWTIAEAPKDRRLAIGLDITERKQRERAIERAKEKAEEASRLKSAMLANMSHEIRTPLTSIIGFAELLKGEASGEAAGFAERIRQGGERLMKTLDSVLELSRLEAGVGDLSREEVSLRGVVRETIDILRPVAEEKSISIETELPESSAKGHWNEGALTRILENLLENAIKFTPEGGLVEVRARLEEGNAVLEVEDSGIGISEEAQTEIFRAFKQESEGLDREYEGTGLGLSIARRLTEAHGGSLEVESKKGEGSLFTVRLPTGNGGDGDK